MYIYIYTHIIFLEFLDLWHVTYDIGKLSPPREMNQGTVMGVSKTPGRMQFTRMPATALGREWENTGRILGDMMGVFFFPNQQ